MRKRITDFLNPSIYREESKRRQARVLTLILWTSFAASVLFVIISLVQADRDPAIVSAVFALSTLASLWLIRRGYLAIPSHFLPLLLLVLLTYRLVMGNGIHDIAAPIYPLVIVFSALILGRRSMIVFWGLSVLSVALVVWMEVHGMVRPTWEGITDYSDALVASIVLSVTALLAGIIEANIAESIGSLRGKELALQASEERFRKVFQSSVVAICIADLEDGRLIEANAAFWELTGMSAAETLGRTALELGLWEDPGERLKFIRQLKEKHSLEDIEYRYPASGRDTLAFYELIQIGDQPAILSMFYDVSEQKRAREALRESEARTRALLDAIPDMIFELSAEGTFLNYIPAQGAEAWLPARDFPGKKIGEVLPPEIAASAMFAVQRAMQSRQLHSFEYQLPVKNGIRSYEARVAASSEASAIVMVRDITLRKQFEAEREGLIAELEAKNAELERFTYTVSHDLKSPLITIKGFLGFLERDALSGDAERLAGDVGRIADATDKMQRLLNELLELSRVGRLMSPPQPISFGDLVREALELLHGSLQAGHVQVQVQEDLPEVYGDRARLVEVLQNLLDNAAKFMGGQPEPRVEIGTSGRDDSGKPVFFVRDNGIGIAPQFHERIFGLFNKLDSQSEGTGIGLALVKRIVEVHGGRIWVESAPGGGTTFLFTLPQK